jgi:chromosome segregation ATPase
MITKEYLEDRLKELLAQQEDAAQQVNAINGAIQSMLARREDAERQVSAVNGAIQVVKHLLDKCDELGAEPTLPPDKNNEEG